MTIHSNESRTVSLAALDRRPSLLVKRQNSLGLPGYPIPQTASASGNMHTKSKPLDKAELLRDFVASHYELEGYKSGKLTIPLDGTTLTLPAVHAVARYPSLVADSLVRAVDRSPANVARIERSRQILDEKLSQNKSIYGVSTGFGGSADTRTDDHALLGLALLQHQHAGVLPLSLEGESSTQAKDTAPIPLSDPLNTMSMPTPWVRAALLIRLNTLLRGHSAISFPLLGGATEDLAEEDTASMLQLLARNLTPVVPLRGSISASGDLSPLSYIAGALVGEPGIFVHTPARQIVRAPAALAAARLRPATLRPKEHLGILNGTAFSCGLAALCVSGAREMVLLGAVCTALGSEAMRGCAGSFGAFVQDVRPHAGQREAGALLMHLLGGSALVSGADAENGEGDEGTIEDDAGTLRQDRYPLRTAPQWLGPQIEEVVRAAKVVKVECNSTTDNPLIDPATGTVHHGGNFQAMSVTMVMESLRLSLHHVGKLLFAQSTELGNPAMNNGLAGNLASTDPSLNFFGKGLDIAQAAYVSELAYLANPVSTGVQSAEMHNQAVNSLAMISARYTLQALDVLQLLVASYLYLLCQALDLRALQHEMRRAVEAAVPALVAQELTVLTDVLGEERRERLEADIVKAVWAAYDTSAGLDARPRAGKAARASTQPLVDACSSTPAALPALSALPAFQAALAASILSSHGALTRAFLEGSLDASAGAFYLPAARLMGRTRALYAFVRRDLGVGMHGRENLARFAGGLGQGESEAEPAKQGRTIGGEVSVIYEAIRDGRMAGVLVGMFEGAL